jgi:transitional endoplasmic reticulum ATPase
LASLARRNIPASAQWILWGIIASVLVSSFFLYRPQSNAPAGVADWIFRSWPALFACSAGMRLLLAGPLMKTPPLFRKAGRLVMIFFAYSGFLYLLRWNPFWRWMLSLGFENRNKTEGFLILVSTLAWLVASLRVIWPGMRVPVIGSRPGGRLSTAPEMKATRPGVTFADVGGMEDAKQQIRDIVENRLNSGRFARHGVVRNGILLHGPRGSGKTFLAEATAGEFGLNYCYVAPTQLTSMWVGGTEGNIRSIFEQAIGHEPALLFIDEMDALGAARVNIREAGDLGGSNRGYNDAVVQFMQSIDQYRSASGIVIMAATNALDCLDPALIRDGRFDAHIRVEMPDEATRERIFEAQLKRKPWKPCGLEEFARRTPGASAAKIRAIVDRAAALAASENRRIEDRDLRKSLDETGGRDRPHFQPAGWEDLVLEPDVEGELRTLVTQLNSRWSDKRGLSLPSGVLLIGPPGAGKTMIGRMLATETRRSFYPVNAADVLGGRVGDSVRKVSELFARARENNPSIIFFDEIDGLLPRSNGTLSPHDVQLVEQCRTEISQLLPEHNVLLVATTNHPERIDPAIMRGGRFSEKIEIPLPGQQNRERLLRKYLAGLAVECEIDRLAERLTGLSPADIEAVCKSAVRRAFGRTDNNELPPLVWDDFEHAIKRVSVSA